MYNYICACMTCGSFQLCIDITVRVWIDSPLHTLHHHFTISPSHHHITITDHRHHRRTSFLSWHHHRRYLATANWPPPLISDCLQTGTVTWFKQDLQKLSAVMIIFWMLCTVHLGIVFWTSCLYVCCSNSLKCAETCRYKTQYCTTSTSSH